MEMNATALSGAPAGRRLNGYRLATVLGALMLTLLLEALDQTVVGTAMPKIIGSLNGFDRYTWVVTAYLLASVTIIPIVGKLSDQFGRKGFFLVGVVLFLLGSALSGAAQTIEQLIAFRALQGLGAGFGISLVFTVVGDIFPPAERAKWAGIFTAVYGLSSVAGPTLGGWLADNGPLVGSFVTETTRWRWVFYVNLPIGLIALLAIVAFLPANISVRTGTYHGWAALRRVDFLGAALASAATICLLLGLTWGGNGTYAWSSAAVIGVLAASALLFAAFFLAERFAAEPILPLGLFRNQVFAADALLALCSGAVLLALVIYLPLFLQGVLGESATNSGEVITPLTVCLVLGAGISGFVVARFKRYQLVTIAGALILTAGVFLLSRMTPTTPLAAATAYMVVAGLGLGIFFSIMTLAVQNALPRTRLGVGTGAITYLRSLGQVLGVAVFGTVVNNTIASDLATRLPSSVKTGLSPQALHYASDPQVLVSPAYRAMVVDTAQRFAVHFATVNVPPGSSHDATVARIAAQMSAQTLDLLTQVFHALRLSLAVGIQRGFYTTLVFCAGVVVASLFLKDVPLATSWGDEPAASAVGVAEPEGSRDVSAPVA
jgi:EmrB/QacA subfamily drug resistance transporter